MGLRPRPTMDATEAERAKARRVQLFLYAATVVLIVAPLVAFVLRMR
ncbi:MAG: hypothetical protein RLZZ15_514 [Verrucomicrobiota bacterium]